MTDVEVDICASTAAIHVVVVVIVLGGVIEVGVAVVYKSIVGTIFIPHLVE